jgi:CubicO group peptidase (beta-lactamase class C family)
MRRVVLALMVGLAVPGTAHARCTPEMDRARLQRAMDWATVHTSASVAVYRHGCLAARSRLDPVTSQVPMDGWSMTKTVTALLVGRAVTLKRFDIDRPLRTWFPEADAEHGALTARHLLTMTAGLHVNWVRDLSPQPDRIRDALALPFDFPPGREWQYFQSGPTLLAEALTRAVGQDLQDFAHEQLFAPLDIPRDAWIWDRDRAGHTEGWAHLRMRASGWAKLGQLMLDGGRGLIAKRYLREMTTPGAVNNAYGFLVWLNGGGSYVLPDVAGPDEGSGPIVASGPRDMIVWAGSGEQRIFVIPSRDLLIVRLGERGSRELDTRASVWTGRGGQLDNELVRRVLRAVRDVPYDDPGPYAGSDLFLPPHDAGVIGDAQETEHVVAGLTGS